jgi:hypothetical protein
MVMVLFSNGLDTSPMMRSKLPFNGVFFCQRKRHGVIDAPRWGYHAIGMVVPPFMSGRWWPFCLTEAVANLVAKEIKRRPCRLSCTNCEQRPIGACGTDLHN